MSNERIRETRPDTDVPERLALLEKLFQRVQKAAMEAAAACGQYAVQADDAPYTGPALPRREAFQVVMRNDPAAGTFVRRLQGREVELKTAAAIIVAELANGRDDAVTSICREIEAAVVATNQKQRDDQTTTFTGHLDTDFPLH